jgi:mannose-6-phosphate isomerase-like protein (cupin superfamily)
MNRHQTADQLNRNDMGTVLNTAALTAMRNAKVAALGELGIAPICVAPGKEALAHSHNLIEEVIIVHKGKGKVQIEDEVFDVCAGSVAVIPAGQFHSICNVGRKNLEATAIFNANVDRSNVVLKNRKEHFQTADATVDALCAEVKALKKAYKKLKKKAK